MFLSWGRLKIYRAFHRFGQAKFPDGGSVLGSSQLSIFNTAPAASKNDTWFKSGQIGLKVVKIDSEINNSLC